MPGLIAKIRRWWNGSGAGADRTQPPLALPNSTPSPVQSFYSADSTPSPPSPSAAPPIKDKVKRERIKEPTAEFIAMLAEAVDRNGALEWLEMEFKSYSSEMSNLHLHRDEGLQRAQFLKAKVKDVPALEPALNQAVGQICDYETWMGEYRAVLPLLEMRLSQSRAQLSELLSRIYNATEAFMDSLSQDQTMPPFEDVSLKTRDDVDVPWELMSTLRLAAECSTLLKVKVARVEDKRKKYSRAVEAARAASPKQRGRLAERKFDKFKGWRREAGDFQMSHEHQRQRERRMLSSIVKEWLVDEDLMHAPDPVNIDEEAEELEDEAGDEEQDYEIVHPADGEPPLGDDEVVSAKTPTSVDLDQQR